MAGYPAPFRLFSNQLVFWNFQGERKGLDVGWLMAWVKSETERGGHIHHEKDGIGRRT